MKASELSMGDVIQRDDGQLFTVLSIKICEEKILSYLALEMKFFNHEENVPVAVLVGETEDWREYNWVYKNVNI